ncbi:MAG: hypothetical protein IJ443_03295 [Firmicutes bacterium]|nr:hypothetical protein [Bacillota bacterium]
MNEMTMKDIMFELCSLTGVGGFEGPIRDWIMEQARPYADEMKVDKMGNLLVYRRGRQHLDRPLALFAHMDEPGFLVSGITREGMVQLTGRMPAKSIIGKQMEIHRQGMGREGSEGSEGSESSEGSVVYGVTGMKADHLQTEEEQKKTPDLSKLLVDIGCTCEADARELVREGNVAVPYVEPEMLGCPVGSTGDDGYTSAGVMMTGRGLASRAGCAVLLELLKEEPTCDCWFVFSVSGENWSLVPGKGAMLAARLLNPRLAVVLHAVDTGEGPGVPAEKLNCRCGEGAAISLQDGDFVFDRGLRQIMTDEANEQGVLWQYHTGNKQVTGAGRLASAGGGCFVLPVNLPIRFLGAEAGVCSLYDLDSMAAMCRIVMEKAGEL